MTFDFCRSPTFAGRRPSDSPFELCDSDPDALLAAAVVRAESSDSEDVILPDPDYVPPEPGDSDDWVRPAVGEFLTERASPCRPRLLSAVDFEMTGRLSGYETPLLDAQYREGREKLRTAVCGWKLRIDEERMQGQRRMERLLERHAAQNEEFQSTYACARFLQSAPVQYLDVVESCGSSSVLKAKPIMVLTGLAKVDRLPDDIALKKKRMVDRHIFEICALNTELENRIAQLMERRDIDIARKKATVDRLKAELCLRGAAIDPLPACEDLSATPRNFERGKPGRLVRVAVGPFDEFGLRRKFMR
jgi:hypothetical protein